MSTWVQIMEARSNLLNAPEPQNTQRYVELDRETEKAPPYHLRPILRHLEEVEATTGKQRADINVLDYVAAVCLGQAGDKKVVR